MENEQSMNNVNDSDSLLCPICLEKLSTFNINSHLDGCKHILCESCFKIMIQYSNICPLCNKIFLTCINKDSENKVIAIYELNDHDFELIKKNKENKSSKLLICNN